MWWIHERIQSGVEQWSQADLAIRTQDSELVGEDMAEGSGVAAEMFTIPGVLFEHPVQQDTLGKFLDPKTPDAHKKMLVGR